MQESIASLAGAAGTLVVFGIMMGLHPTVYGATLNLLARGLKTRTYLTCLVGGLVSGVILMLLALLLVNPESYITALSGHINRVMLNRWVDLTAGIVFLVVAAGIIVWKLVQPTLKAKPEETGKSGAAGGVYFGIGFSAPVFNPAMWPVMYLVSRTLTSGSGNILLQVVGIVLFLVTVVAPFLLLAWAWSRFPGSTQKISDGYRRILAFDHRWWVAGVLAVMGAVVIMEVLTR